MNSSSLDAIFRPRSVAVIGASRSHGTLGGDLFHNLIAHEFCGPVYPVNRAASEVQSVRAYRSIVDVPETVDLAVIAVPKSEVLAVVDECGHKGVKAVVVITAGFAEVGPSGAAAQAEILRVVRRHGMRMVGPNCLGVINTDPDVRLAATFGHASPPAGNVSFCSQSGALGLAILDYARQLGIGMRHFVSVGNKADVSTNDLLEYWEHDAPTKVILLYVEAFGNPRKFLEIARRVSRTKPVLAVKSGRSLAGARAARTHTGALAGTDAAIEALLLQAGVVRTGTLEELFDAAQLLATQPPPAGPRVAILTNAGGPAIMLSDACEGRGMRVGPLSETTTRALRESLSPDASVANPVDMVAGADAEAYDEALPLLAGDPAVDAVVVLYVPTGRADPLDVARAVCRARDYTTKPILTCFMGTHAVEPARTLLNEGGIPTYAFPESCAVALDAALRYTRSRARPLPETVSPPAAAPAALPDHPLAPRWLARDEVLLLLGKCGITSPESAIVHGAQEAVALAERLGFPVALKIVSDQIAHKTEVGGVRLGLGDGEAVLRAFRQMDGRLSELGKRALVSGFEVQKMAPPGVETLVGISTDPSVGPLVAFGIGGINAEIWKDVVFRVQPISQGDAEEMLRQLRGAQLLEGFRGAPPVDRAALVRVLLAISRLVDERPEILELDINPLVALADGRGVIAVDARVLVRA
jgi:acetyl coenzyme A synthetase (ADP forming)-like protein